MHQNMKNFYDHQDIKVSITLRPEDIATPPACSLIVNNTVLFDSSLTSIRLFETTIELLQPVCVQVILKDKDYNTMPTVALFIDSLKIDNFDIVPVWTGFAQYSNDKNVTGPTNFLGYNGIWLLNTREPFYRWQHKITGQGWLLEP